MTFLHPWMLALGGAAVALPVAIHWLTRPRPRRLPLSTVRFVLQAIQQRRARNRLRDWLILALRMLAILLLAGAVARPRSASQPLVTPAESAKAARVVMLDVSQSMAAQAHGIQVFERARPLAAGYLADQPDLQANLILAGTRAHPVFDRLSGNRASLREELARAQPGPEKLDVQSAINAAAELLAASPAGQRRELVVISDFQRSNWVAADFSSLPEDTVVQLDSVAPAEPLVNLAVLRVGSQGRAEEGREIRLEVEVGNFSPTPRQVQVELVLGEANYRLEGLCPPQNKTTLTTEVALPGAGWKVGEARLVDVSDALPADNVRPFVLEIHPTPTYALLTRQRAEQRPSSSYYLERALVPLAPRPGRAEARVVWIDPTHFDREVLSGADVLVVDHPGRLATEIVQLLANLVRRGRGLFYVAAETTDAANLKLLAETAGAELQMPVDFVPPPAAQRRRDLFLTEVRRDQAPFGVFGDSFAATISPLRFSGGLASRRREGALADDILAAYNDRSACLVVSACGAGVVAVLNADLTSSNLHASPAFVPLLGELMGRFLSRRQGSESVACGEPLAVYLPPSAGPAAGLRIVGPPPLPALPPLVGEGTGGWAGRLAEESGGVLWRCSRMPGPGVYQVHRDGKAVFAVAAAIPSEESDLRTLPATVFQERLAGGRKVHFRTAAGPGEERDDFWVLLGVACLVCLLGEVVALKWFRT